MRTQARSFHWQRLATRGHLTAIWKRATIITLATAWRRRTTPAGGDAPGDPRRTLPLYLGQTLDWEVVEVRWNRIGLVVAVGLLMATCFYAGWMTGSLRKFGWMLEVQEAEVTGSLNQEASALTYIRAGDHEKAIRLLETRVGTVATTLPQGREWVELGESQRQSLVLAKKYFAIYPPRSESQFGGSVEPLKEVLEWIPDEPLDPESCSPTVRLLLEGGHPDTNQPVE